MKKNTLNLLKIGIGCLATFTIAAITLNSCNKDEALSKNKNGLSAKSPSGTKEPDTHASLKNSDAFLIAAIQGSDPNYYDLGKLEQLLMDHAPLSKDVLISAVNSDRVPNQTVEFITVISAPVHEDVISAIASKRTNLSMSSISDAQTLPVGQKFIVAFTNRRTIIFGSDLVRLTKQSSSCDDCSSQVQGSADSRMIILTETDDNPSSMSKNCDSSKNACGWATAVKKEGRESQPVYVITCDTSVDKVCFSTSN